MQSKLTRLLEKRALNLNVRRLANLLTRSKVVPRVVATGTAANVVRPTATPSVMRRAVNLVRRPTRVTVQQARMSMGGPDMAAAARAGAQQPTNRAALEGLFPGQVFGTRTHQVAPGIFSTAPKRQYKLPRQWAQRTVA